MVSSQFFSVIDLKVRTQITETSSSPGRFCSLPASTSFTQSPLKNSTGAKRLTCSHACINHTLFVTVIRLTLSQIFQVRKGRLHLFVVDAPSCVFFDAARERHSHHACDMTLLDLCSSRQGGEKITYITLDSAGFPHKN